MKICRIIYTYSPFFFGGAGIYTEKIQRALTKHIDSAVIITINPSWGQVIEEYNKTKIYRFHPFNISTIHSIGKKSLIKQGIWTFLDIYSFYSYRKIRDILKKEKPDIVHIHTPIDVTLSAVSAAKSLHIPVVYTLHDYFLLCRRFTLLHGSGRVCTNKDVNLLCKFYREFAKKIVDKVDIVVVPSKFVLDKHVENGFFANSEKIVLPHGIEIDSIPEQGKPRDLEEGKLHILYSGGLTKHKGVHILISALKQVRDNNITLHIAGEGIYGDRLKRLAEDDSRIVFYGRLPNEEVQQFYKMVDILVVPSICYDVRPNVIPEAFKAGVPVIASNIGGIPELVKDNYNGFLFETANSEQLKAILESIIKNPESLKKLGKNAGEFVKQFEMSEYIAKLCQVYEKAIALRR